MNAKGSKSATTEARRRLVEVGTARVEATRRPVTDLLPNPADAARAAEARQEEEARADGRGQGRRSRTGPATPRPVRRSRTPSRRPH